MLGGLNAPAKEVTGPAFSEKNEEDNEQC